MPCRSKTWSTPACAMPRAKPPPKARPIRGAAGGEGSEPNALWCPFRDGQRRAEIKLLTAARAARICPSRSAPAAWRSELCHSDVQMHCQVAMFRNNSITVWKSAREFAMWRAGGRLHRAGSSGTLYKKVRPGSGSGPGRRERRRFYGGVDVEIDLTDAGRVGGGQTEIDLRYACRTIGGRAGVGYLQGIGLDGRRQRSGRGRDASRGHRRDGVVQPGGVGGHDGARRRRVFGRIQGAVLIDEESLATGFAVHGEDGRDEGSQCGREWLYRCGGILDQDLDGLRRRERRGGGLEGNDGADLVR